MMPVVRGKRSTRWQMMAYALILVPLGLAPAAIGIGGPLYLAAAVGLGGLLLLNGIAVLRERDAVNEPAARRLFAVSIFYLFSLFAALIAEHLLGVAPLQMWT
jgi:protoheme IX farnesyltransferase